MFQKLIKLWIFMKNAFKEMEPFLKYWRITSNFHWYLDFIQAVPRKWISIQNYVVFMILFAKIVDNFVLTFVPMSPFIRLLNADVKLLLNLNPHTKVDLMWIQSLYYFYVMYIRPPRNFAPFQMVYNVICNNSSHYFIYRWHNTKAGASNELVVSRINKYVRLYSSFLVSFTWITSKIF